MMTHQYIGLIEHSWTKDEGKTIAHVKPLARLRDSGLMAIPIDDVAEEFPIRGRVTWFESEFERGDVVLFTPRIGGTFEPDQGRPDKYIIDRDCRPPELTREVVDYIDDGIDLRELLVVEGVTEPPLGNSVYVRIDHNRIAGPVQFQNRDGLWRIDRERLNKLPLKVFGYSEETQALRVLNRSFLATGRMEHRGQLDWADATIVLSRTLNKARTLTLSSTEHLSFTRRVIDELVDELSLIDFDPLDRSRLEASWAYLNQLEEDVFHVDELIDALLRIPRVANQFDVRRRDLLEEARAQANAIVDEAMSEARRSVERLEQQSESLTQALKAKASEVERIDAQIEARKQYEKDALEQQFRELQEALGEKVEEMLAEPSRILAELAVYRMAFHGAGNQDERTGKGGYSDRHLPIVVPYEDAKEQDLETAIKRSRQFVTPSLSQWLYRTLLSGAVPAVPAPSAQPVLNALDYSLVGAATIRIPVPPTITGVNELFVERQSNSAVAPSTNGLLDIVLQAQGEPDRLLLVVLEGANRAAVSLYLLPLLRLYSREIRRLRLFRPEQMAADSPFLHLADLEWPRNVLLLVTVSDPEADFTALPLPNEFWHYAIPVQAEARRRASRLDRNDSPARISFTEWQSHVEHAHRRFEGINEDIRDTLDSLDLRLDEVVLERISRFLDTDVPFDPQREGSYFKHWLSILAPNVDFGAVDFTIEDIL